MNLLLRSNGFGRQAKVRAKVVDVSDALHRIESVCYGAVKFGLSSRSRSYSLVILFEVKRQCNLWHGVVLTSESSYSRQVCPRVRFFQRIGSHR